MQKLNKRGYITVELLLASVIAAAIAIFLIDITVRLVGDTDDAYVDTILTSDKALILNKIKDDVNNYELEKIENRDNGVVLYFLNGSNRELYFDKNTLHYGNYEKTFDVNFEKKEFSINTSGSYINLKLTLKTLFSDNDYGFNIIIPKGQAYYTVTITLYDAYNNLYINPSKTYKVYYEDGMGSFYLDINDIMNLTAGNNPDYYFVGAQASCQSSNVTYQTSEYGFDLDVFGNDECTIYVCPENQRSDSNCQSR